VKHVLLIDDQSKDLASAADVAQSLGVEDIQTKSSITSARAHLEKALTGEVPLPDAIVLDLDLGMDSGFELLRFWHSTPALSGIPMIVWSVVEEQRNICELFKVKTFVSKWQGASALREALAQLVS
jgi:CheY-like chemotaxis protein